MLFARWLKQRQFTVWLLVLALSLALVGSASASAFPGVIPLPNGFQPEGIATGNGSTFFAGSIPTGAIYRGDYATGAGSVLVPERPGRMAIGLKFDSRSGLLFVAGGPTGSAFVYNGETGAEAASIQLTASTTTFVNDVVITKRAVYFTDSFQPLLYRVALNHDGSLPDPLVSEPISLSGDYEFVPGGFNANGIEATPNGETLVIVNSTQGKLYNVDPKSGNATLIDLGGGAVPAGDGILLHGKTLYVVQNALNQVAVVELDARLASGFVDRLISSPDFRVPTTIARFGASLYAVNARFGTPPEPDTEYEVVRIPRQ